MTDQIKLFEPLKIRDITLPNRIVISPMCQYSANDGYLDAWHLVHLGRFAAGGAGLIFTEATAVQKSGRITHGCPGLWCDSQIAGHAQVTSFALQNGAVPALQLGHAGRKSGMQRPWFGNAFLTNDDVARGDMPWQNVGPSALPVDQGWPVPHELTQAQIETFIDDFVAATKRALQAGYKVLEIHGAHGYLLHSFLSPLSNKRTDEYGGSLENRMRLATDVATRVRAVWPSELPLFFRISSVDGTSDGWTIADSVNLANSLKTIGVDVIDCSSGGIAGSATAAVTGKRQPGFQVPYAAQVRAEAGITTMTVGLITHPLQAEEILNNGSADLIAIGREALANPNWPLHAAEVLSAPDNFANRPKQSGWWLERRVATSDFYSPA